MTTFIPSLTLPAVLFQTPAAAILFPIALGTAVGFTVQRRSPSSYSFLLPSRVRTTNIFQHTKIPIKPT